MRGSTGPWRRWGRPWRLSQARKLLFQVPLHYPVRGVQDGHDSAVCSVLARAWECAHESMDFLLRLGFNRNHHNPRVEGSDGLRSPEFQTQAAAGGAGDSRQGGCRGGPDLSLQSLRAFGLSVEELAPGPFGLNPGAATSVGKPLQLEVIEAKPASPIVWGQGISWLGEGIDGEGIPPTPSKMRFPELGGQGICFWGGFWRMGSGKRTAWVGPGLSAEEQGFVRGSVPHRPRHRSPQRHRWDGGPGPWPREVAP